MKRRERMREARVHEVRALSLLERAAGLLEEKLSRLRQDGAGNGAPIDDELERTWPGPEPEADAAQKETR